MASIANFVNELRRRNVFKSAALYIIAAWLLLQVAALALESWGFPSRLLRILWIFALIGFPLSIVFGWIYDIKDGGIVRTSAAEAGAETDLSLHRNDYFLLAAMAVILVAVAYGTFRQTQSTDPVNTSDHIGISVSTWPEADTMFRRDPYWLGGDASDSVDLGGGRVLWLFGDSFISSEAGQSRAEGKFIRNSIAIQRGYDPSSATLQFYWRVNDSLPASFFEDNQNSWFWPMSAVLIDGSLVIFLVETIASNKGLGFENIGMAAVGVDNPQDTPDRWRLHYLSLPENKLGVLIGVSETIRVADYIYAFGKQESTNDVYLLRWSLEKLSAKSLDSPEWWSGGYDKWVEGDNHDKLARPVLSDTPTNFSVHYDKALKKFVLLQTWGFGQAVVAIRTAKMLTGPWSERQIIYRPGESNRADGMVYGGKGHIHLLGADIVATYNANSEVFSNVLIDQSIYYPRFIRVEIAP